VGPVAPGCRHATASTSAWALGQDMGHARMAKGAAGSARGLRGRAGPRQAEKTGGAGMVGRAGLVGWPRAHWGGSAGRGGSWAARQRGARFFLFLSYFFIFCSFLPFSFPIRI
jgi:hypothetical protein